MPEATFEVRRFVDNLKQYFILNYKKLQLSSLTKKDFKKQKLLFEDLPLKIIDVKNVKVNLFTLNLVTICIFLILRYERILDN